MILVVLNDGSYLNGIYPLYQHTTRLIAKTTSRARAKS